MGFFWPSIIFDFLDYKNVDATNTNFATVASIIKAGGYPVYLDMTLKSYCSSYDELKKKFNKFKFKGVAWVHIGGVISKDFIKVVNFCKKKIYF